jgi:hypothetical protein
VPTVVVDQLVKGVVAADDELELEELLPPPVQAAIAKGSIKVKLFLIIIFSALIYKINKINSYKY